MGNTTIAVPVNDFQGLAANWNWNENFVQEDENLSTGANFIAAESTLIAAGFAKATPSMQVVKIGLCPSIQVSQQIPQQRLYEIGSQRCHILNGIPQGGLSINRLIYNGPSLVRSLYGLTIDASNNITTGAMNGTTTANNAAQAAIAAQWSAMNGAAKIDSVISGHQDTNLWLSMWDTRFRMPFGLAVFMQDIKGNSVGGLYFEGCKVGNHQFSQSAGQMIMMEGLSIMFDRSVPIVKGLTSGAGAS